MQQSSKETEQNIKSEEGRSCRGAHRRSGNVGEQQRSGVSKEEEAKEARENGGSWERLGWEICFRWSVASAVGDCRPTVTYVCNGDVVLRKLRGGTFGPPCVQRSDGLEDLGAVEPLLLLHTATACEEVRHLRGEADGHS